MAQWINIQDHICLSFIAVQLYAMKDVEEVILETLRCGALLGNRQIAGSFSNVLNNFKQNRVGVDYGTCDIDKQIAQT